MASSRVRQGRRANSPMMGPPSIPSQRIQLPARVREVRGILKQRLPKQLHPSARTSDSDMVQDEMKNLITGSTMVTIHPTKSYPEAITSRGERIVLGGTERVVMGPPRVLSPSEKNQLPSVQRRNILAPQSFGRSDMSENTRRITDASRQQGRLSQLSDRPAITIQGPPERAGLADSRRPLRAADPPRQSDFRERVEFSKIVNPSMQSELIAPDYRGSAAIVPPIVIEKETQTTVPLNLSSIPVPIYSPPTFLAPRGMSPQNPPVSTPPPEVYRNYSEHTAYVSNFSSAASPTPAQVMQHHVALHSNTPQRLPAGQDHQYGSSFAHGPLVPPSQKSHLLRPTSAQPLPTMRPLNGQGTTGASVPRLPAPPTIQPSTYRPVETPHLSAPPSPYAPTMGASFRQPPAAGSVKPILSSVGHPSAAMTPSPREVVFSPSTASGSLHESSFSPAGESPELFALRTRLAKLEEAERKNSMQKRLHAEYVKSLQSELAELRTGARPAALDSTVTRVVPPSASYFPPRSLQPSPFVANGVIRDGRAPLPAWADGYANVHEPLSFQKICRGEESYSGRLSSYTTSASASVHRGRHHHRSRSRGHHHDRSRSRKHGRSRSGRGHGRRDTKSPSRRRRDHNIEEERQVSELSSHIESSLRAGSQEPDHYQRTRREQRELRGACSPARDARAGSNARMPDEFVPPVLPPRNEMEVPPPARNHWQMPTVDDLEVPSVASSGRHRQQRRAPVFPNIEGETESAIENRIGNLKYVDDPNCLLPSEEDPFADYITVHNALKPMRKQPQCCG